MGGDAANRDEGAEQDELRIRAGGGGCKGGAEGIMECVVEVFPFCLGGIVRYRRLGVGDHAAKQGGAGLEGHVAHYCIYEGADWQAGITHILPECAPDQPAR